MGLMWAACPWKGPGQSYSNQALNFLTIIITYFPLKKTLLKTMKGKITVLGGRKITISIEIQWRWEFKIFLNQCSRNGYGPNLHFLCLRRVVGDKYMTTLQRGEVYISNQYNLSKCQNKEVSVRYASTGCSGGQSSFIIKGSFLSCIYCIYGQLKSVTTRNQR